MTEKIDPARLRALLAAATPGPWLADTADAEDCVIWGPRQAGDDRKLLMNVGGANPSRVGVAFDADAHNAALTAAAVNALPAMLDRLDALESELSDAYRHIRQTPHRRDHACARCVPGGEMVIAGFVCVPHRALDASTDADGWSKRLDALEAVAAAARARCADAVPQWAPELREALRALDEDNDRSRR